MKPSILVLILLPLMLFLSCTACSLPFGEEAAPRSVSILSWNVQNLFDDVADGGEYDEFDPAQGEWDSALFRIRLNRIKEVLESALEEYPHILLLQEVENRNTLEILAGETLKDRYPWRIIVEDDDSSIQTALLSTFPVLSVASLETGFRGQYKLRPITEVRLDLGGRDLILFNNHWKSRSGGAAATEEGRIKAAQVLTERVFHIAETEPEALILAAGDFNESHDEYKRMERGYRTAIIPVIEEVPTEWSDSLYVSSKGSGSGIREEKAVFYSPWYDISSAGTYVYKSQWSKIDHFFLWSSFFDGKGFEYGSFEVLKEDFLLDDYNYPARWDSFRQEGYSDHLPILLWINENDI